MVTVRPVRYTDRDAFATSHYHIADTIIEKATCYEQVCRFSIVVYLLRK
jgi:hypothetical protein